MASLPTIIRYLALFQEVYPINELTDLTAEAWAIALEDVDDQSFIWAARRLLKEDDARKYFPTPNEVRSFLAKPNPRARLMLPSNDPSAKAIQDYYAEVERNSKRIRPEEASS